MWQKAEVGKARRLLDGRFGCRLLMKDNSNVAGELVLRPCPIFVS